LANIYSVVQELKAIYEHEEGNRLSDESARFSDFIYQINDIIL